MTGHGHFVGTPSPARILGDGLEAGREDLRTPLPIWEDLLTAVDASATAA